MRVDHQPDGFVCQARDDSLGSACVYVAGELDIASVPHLERVLRRAEVRARLLVLDLRDLTFMDSCGLRVIAETNHHAPQAGRRLILVPGPPQVQRLLALSGVGDGLEVAEPGDIDPAVQALLQAARTA